VEDDGILKLLVTGAWSPNTAKVAKRFRILGLEASVTPPENHSLHFLSGLPKLRTLALSSFWMATGRSLVDWRQIERLSHLERLSLSCYEPEGEPCEIDFTKLSRLESCNLTWRETWSSIMRVKNLQELRIRDERNKLKELDGRELRQLKKLELSPCFALKTVRLAESTRLTELSLGGTPKLNLDWTRFGRDLKKLHINGRVGFALDELRAARKLRRLSLLNMKKVTSLQFLRDLPTFEIIDSWNNKLSDADDALVDAIIKRFKKRQAHTKSKRR